METISITPVFITVCRRRLCLIKFLSKFYLKILYLPAMPVFFSHLENLGTFRSTRLPNQRAILLMISKCGVNLRSETYINNGGTSCQIFSLLLRLRLYFQSDLSASQSLQRFHNRNSAHSKNKTVIEVAPMEITHTSPKE